MAKRMQPRASKASASTKASKEARAPRRAGARDEQRRLHKTLTWLADKQELGLSEEDIRTTLTKVGMPNSRVRIGRSQGISVADRDPRDPITGADQDPRDPFLWQTDLDPTDPARRPQRP
jgi:hypothetical protein